MYRCALVGLLVASAALLSDAFLPSKSPSIGFPPSLRPFQFCPTPPLAAKPDDNESLEQPTSWLATLCLPLWIVYVSNQWSRSSIYYLVDFGSQAEASQAMNVDIGFGEAQYGLLASVAFTSLFAVASLGAGVAADRTNRKTLTIASALGWSVATLATAVASDYNQVVAARILMGLACAFSTPTAYTLIKDGVPDSRQALASSLYGTGVAAASGLASLCIIIDQQLGWRGTLDLIAVFGLTSAILAALLLPNDPKTLSSSGDSDTLRELNIVEDIQQIVATDRVKWLFLGSFLRFSSGLSIGVWGASFFRMNFADDQSSYAVAQAVISVVAASLSGLLGGSVADWLSSQTKEDPVGRRLWVPVVGSILAAPTWYWAVQTDQSFETAMAWLAAEYFVAECWFGPTISTMQATVGPAVGGTAQGIFTLTGAVANFAPSLLGYIYGLTTSSSGESPTELSSLLAAGVCFGYLSSAFCFGMASLSVPEDTDAKKQ